MAKFIKSIHDRINFAIKKGLTGYISPSNIDAEVHAESLNLWKKYSALYEKDSDITAIMDVFRRPESVTLTAGVGTMSAAYQRPVGVFDSTGKKIEVVDVAMWADRINHPLKTPSTDYPVAMFENRQINVRPTSLTSCIVRYLKYPTAPVYAFSVVGTRYVYNDAASTDIEWPEIVHDDIMLRVLSNLGINMREPVMMQYSQMEKAQEGK